MSWIDMVAYMSAQRHSERTHVVTVNIDTIEFKKAIKNGDHVVLTSRVEYVGNTSMEIKVDVEREDHFENERYLAANATLTFVALDEYHRPCTVPKLKLETLEDCKHYLEACVRIKVRKKLKNWFEKNAMRLMQKSEALLVRIHLSSKAL
jgi:acyl-CoA hydrolase